jgi:2-oxo-4-hydroxy-4-carboxy-5-ureidoimidazoline decarboxylase
MSGVFVYTRPEERDMKSIYESDEVSVLNKLTHETLYNELYRCCGSSTWVSNMVKAMPFQSVMHLKACAEYHWYNCSEADWMEAFSNHPRIGDVNALKEKFKKNPNAWEGGEQSGADNASETTIQSLKDGNDAYDAKFGFLFLVCATGKTAEEMLMLLTERLKNERMSEVLIAVGEQNKITHLRLAKLLTSRSNL